MFSGGSKGNIGKKRVDREGKMALVLVDYNAFNLTDHMAQYV